LPRRGGRLREVGARFILRDRGSRYGTYVNGERVAGERELKLGDVLKIGPLQFEIEIAHGIGGKKRPAVADLKEAAARTAQSSSSSKFDVADWLADEPADASTATMKLKDTHRLRLGDTETVAMTPIADTSRLPSLRFCAMSIIIHCPRRPWVGR
jgi:predicted component of type VI protein secretion system